MWIQVLLGKHRASAVLVLSDIDPQLFQEIKRHKQAEDDVKHKGGKPKKKILAVVKLNSFLNIFTLEAVFLKLQFSSDPRTSLHLDERQNRREKAHFVQNTCVCVAEASDYQD